MGAILIALIVALTSSAAVAGGLNTITAEEAERLQPGYAARKAAAVAEWVKQNPQYAAREAATAANEAAAAAEKQKKYDDLTKHIAQQDRATALRGRDEDYAKCRMAAYQAQASDVTDYTASCMIAGGWVVDGAVESVTAFEWYCLPDPDKRILRQGWCGD